MVNRFQTYFVAYHAYFTAKLHQVLKTFGQDENLVFVIMPVINISPADFGRILGGPGT